MTKPVTLALCAVFSFAAFADNLYNGKWWLSVNERQRKGFVHGFILCYSHLVGRELFRESYAAYSVRLQDYLQGHPQESSGSLDILLQRMATAPYAHSFHRAPAQDNETAEQLNVKWGPHEDADDWRAGQSWDLGYIQGFLECYAKHTKSEYGTFSKPGDWYVKAISGWYGIKEGDPGSVDVKHEKDKIPEVLFQFSDKSQQTTAH